MRTIMVSFFVFLSVIFGTSSAFISWQEDYDPLDELKIVELNQNTKVQKLSIPEGKNLVPIGAVLSENDINEISYTFAYDISENEIDSINVSNIIFEKDNQTYDGLSDLLNFDIILEDYTELQDTVLVHVTISLNMPETIEQYNMLINSSISYTLDIS